MRTLLGLGIIAALAIGCSDDTQTKKPDYKTRPRDQNVTAADSAPDAPAADLETADRAKVDSKKVDAKKIDGPKTDTKKTADSTPAVDKPIGSDFVYKDQAVPVTGLVINEIDYDQPGSDTAEFLEIYNGGSADVPLGDLAVVFVNGNPTQNKEYNRVNLSTAGSVLKAGQYLVIAAAGVTVPSTALSISLSFAIQNGGDAGYKDGGSFAFDPDGVALINTATKTVIDSLSYEGAITACQITGFSGTTNLVEGTALDALVADSGQVTGSLARLPNGQDTNNANADWKFTGTPTPGEANK